MLAYRRRQKKPGVLLCGNLGWRLENGAKLWFLHTLGEKVSLTPEEDSFSCLGK